MANPPLPRTVYESLNTINVYALHNRVPYYNNFTLERTYKVYRLVDEYVQATTGTSPGNMFARVRVCDSSENTTRTDLCLRYPNGNYKPVGEIQRRNEGVKVSAFGYTKEDGNGRYGGVLRAPMHFTGPTYRNPAGVLQSNPQPEWDANTGVFASDPMGVSPTFALSGVINYLNKFGTTGSTLGYYKSNDPVGELYYEALRYFQGLGPTSAAISGLTTTHYDGFPIYGTSAVAPGTLAGWTDPVQNACERRNFILNIGDVNTHYDKQLPGLSTLADATDPARAAEPLLGDGTKVFDSVAWTALLTGFETGTSVAYTDAQGRAQNTAGNPNPNANNTNLQGKVTGSSGSAYYWAGAAYWANTQPIRLDTKAGESMRNIRVKTFTIDVDEGGNGSIEDTNPRGIKPRRSAAYLAGKYGWFKDANLDGNPFRTAGGVTNNSEWEDPEAPNTPDGYVIASQAQKMIDGIRKFFTAATSERGAVSVSAVSSQRFTTNDPNGNLFSPRFDPSDWSGTVQRSGLALNTATSTIETTAGVTWDAGAILTAASLATGAVTDPMVKPDDRRIFTMSRGTGAMVGQEFTVANKTSLDGSVTAALNADPATGTTDSRADARINWIRGNRSDEVNGAGGFLRPRKQIMGDVINSGPVYKQNADPGISGPDYNAFARSVANRVAMIYVGANDGMLHGFRAEDGKELFAYIPRAISENLNKLTGPAYQHRPFVDGVPIVGEAQVGTSWKTVLASGMGGGANGIFALDVSSPTTFGASNVMFEFTDQDDSDMGNVLSQPKIVKMRMAGSGVPVYKWFIAVSSGYNNYKNDGHFSLTGRQALFLLSLDNTGPWVEGSNYFKIMLTDPPTTTAAGLANPSYAIGPQGEATQFYAGDLNGNLWRFDFSNGLSSTTAAGAAKTDGGSGSLLPIMIAKDSSGVRQPITIAPTVTSGLSKGNMIVFGTGKFLEPSDSDNASTQTMYGVWDSMTTSAANFEIGRSKLFQRTMVVGTSTTTLTGTATFAFGEGTGSTYRGWYVDLPTTRERIAVEGVAGPGFTAINSVIPDGTCSGDGSSVSMCFNNLYGVQVCEFVRSTVGLLGRPNIVNMDTAFEAYGLQSATGRRVLTLRFGLISTGTKISDAGNVLGQSTRVPAITLPTDRVGWREVRNFKDN
jgi:type IV pilus assembly protein PilY1